VASIIAVQPLRDKQDPRSQGMRVAALVRTAAGTAFLPLYMGS
jgi:hypothetical protein